MAVNGGRWILRIEPNGAYAFHSEAGDAARPDSGIFSSQAGRWAMRANNGYVDGGAYSILSDDAFVAKGRLGAATWRRVAGAPKSILGQIDGQTVGVWELPVGSGRWVLLIQPDGSYEFRSEANDRTPPNVGEFSSLDGRWSLRTSDGHTDGGTYEFTDPDTFVATGHLGTGAWRRVADAIPPGHVDDSQAPKIAEPQTSTGTGFFISGSGDVLTNAHVVEDCKVIRATMEKGTSARAEVSARDVKNDLALLHTGLAPLRSAAFRRSVRQGEPVEAFGFPLTEVLARSGNFTLGNIAALVGIGEDSRYIQISAPVQPGNSGGPLLDQFGNVVGVVSAKLNALEMMKSTNGDIPQNVNFAIKASTATTFLQTNRADFSETLASQTLAPPDLADMARAMSVFIECNQ
jgi:S1-C subfamily serine protease